MPEKKERLKVYQLSLRHPSLAQFRNRPFAYRTTIRITTILLSFYVAATVPAIIFGALSKSPYREAYGMALLLVCIALAMWMAYPLIVKVAFGSMLAEMNEEQEVARKPAGDVFYVGVIYFNGIATLDEIDSAWDRGWLSIESGCLVYRGINSMFRLPLTKIKTVRTASTNAGTVGASPRVVVQWSHPDGTDEHFVIEVRDSISRKDCRRRIELLVGRIGDAIRLHATELGFDKKELPFRSTAADQAKGFNVNVLTREDFAIAFACSILVWLPMGGLYALASKAIGQSILQILFYLGVFVPAGATFNLVLFWRRAKRLREDASSER